ncbi:MAG: IS66 family insertion sequence element accessory protein TnpB [Granulosicoccus sp.]
MSAKRIRHDQYHWQQLIEKHASSGLSGAQFCREHKVTYASFMNWRKRLQKAAMPPGPASESKFVELTAPSPISEISPAQTQTQSGLCVELTLGTGIELRITRSA